tara:strand:+ start:1041 stop:2249 length:1209 start_codon:yes stop_codon:yes gene_type:complete
MNTTDNKFFCFYPFRAIDILADSSAVPCCRFDERFSENLSYVNDKNSISDAFNSEYFNNLRNKMLAGEKVNGCWKCYKEDDSGVKSMRVGANQYMQETTEIDLEYLEIESGRFCNLKCRSCSPTVSSGFHKEVKSSNFMSNHFRLEPNDEILDPKNQLNKSFLYIAKEQSQKLKYIKVTGGEPLLSEYFLEYIQKLNKWGFSKNITLQFYTNSSFLPKQKLLSALSKFKQIDLFLSIDAIGKKSNYIRSGSDWNTMENVAKQWYNFSVDNKNVILDVNTTISIYNVLYLKELFNWTNEHLKIKWPALSFVHNPSFLSVSSFGVDIRNKILKILKKELNELGFNSDKSPRYKKLINFLENTENSDKFLKFIEFTDNVDKIRNEDWKVIFPELYRLLTGYKNSI